MITRYSALVIKSEDNDIRCEPYGQNSKTGKWSGAINLYHDDFFHTTVISSDSVFESSEESVIFMQNIV